MGPSGSTLTGGPGAGATGLHQLAARALGGHRSRRPPGELAALLLPMVLRVARTARGPGALVRWLGQRAELPRTEQAARRLAEDLVRVLFDPPDSQNDTLGDS